MSNSPCPLSDVPSIALFPAHRPGTAVFHALLIGFLFILTVFGTYGTFDGGLVQTGQSYLQGAFLVALGILAGSLVLLCLRGVRMSPYAFLHHEGMLLLAFYAGSFLALLGAPHKLSGTSASAAASVLSILLITNYVTTPRAFAKATRFLCVFVHFTALVAFVSGAYTYWIGSFTIGPLLLEYNQYLWRVNSWFVTSTAFGVFQAYGIVAAYYLIKRSASPTEAFLFKATIPLFIVGMAMSGARTPFAIVAISFLVLGMSTLSIRRRDLYTLAVMGILIGGACFLLPKYTEDILVLRRVLFNGDTRDLGGRLGMWDYALANSSTLSVFQRSFGTGLGTYREALHVDIAAHSGVLRILVEHGLVGVSLFLALMTTALCRLMAHLRFAQRSTPEMKVLLLFFALFFSAELVIQQLMGISFDYLIFLVILGLHVSSRSMLLRHGRVGSARRRRRPPLVAVENVAARQVTYRRSG